MAAYKSPASSSTETPDHIKKDSKMISKMVLALAVIAVLGGIGWVVFGQAHDGPQISIQTRDEVGSLLTVSDFNEFDRRLDAKIAATAESGVDRAYLEALVDRISDPTAIQTVLPKNTYLAAAAPSAISPDSRILHHDVTMIGGRATYAIHRLTGKTLPSVKASDDLTRLAQIKTQIAAIVLQ